jgi:hypothetical protein
MYFKLNKTVFFVRSMAQNLLLFLCTYSVVKNMASSPVQIAGRSSDRSVQRLTFLSQRDKPNFASAECVT